MAIKIEDFVEKINQHFEKESYSIVNTTKWWWNGEFVEEVPSGLMLMKGGRMLGVFELNDPHTDEIYSFYPSMLITLQELYDIEETKGVVIALNLRDSYVSLARW